MNSPALKTIILAIIFLLAPRMAGRVATAHTNPYQKRRTTARKPVDQQKLKLQAQELADTVLNGNVERAADLTFPKLIELMGGRAQYIAIENRMKAQMASDGFQLSSFTVGEPRDLIEVNRQYFAIVPTTLRMKMSRGTLVGDAFMLGISTDGGQNWTFVDVSGSPLSKAQLRTLFGAAAADRLVLPEVKKPVLYPNE